LNNLYEEVIKEIQDSIKEKEDQIKTFRGILRKYKRGVLKLNPEESIKMCSDIIKGLTKEKEQLLCSIQLYQNILPKRKELLRLKREMENMSSQPG
jgi:hypothetical protein